MDDPPMTLGRPELVESRLRAWARSIFAATVVAGGSPAAGAGIREGDILLAINGAPVQTRADVLDAQNNGGVGTRLDYTLVRLGARQAVAVSLDIWPEPRAVYFVLATVGL